MKDNDILENIRDLYDVKAPSVREKLDFSAVEIVPPPKKSTAKRYIYAVAVYAAACLVVLISLPFIIGGRSNEPKPIPGNADTRTETVAGTRPEDNTNYTTEPENKAVDTTEDQTSASEDVVSDTVYPVPVESSEAISIPEPEPEPEKKPPVAEPAVSTAKKPDVPKTSATTPAVTEPKEDEPTPIKTYPDPADSIKIRFFKDLYMTDEYKSTEDIPYGAKVYYTIDNDPGYICTNLKLNVYWTNVDVIVGENGVPKHYGFYFINDYHGDKLEYSYTAVLAGDADGNLYYDENDVNILQKYLDGDTTTLWNYGVYGYNEKLDYDCNSVVNENDLTGLLAEIETGEAKRNAMSMHGYNSDVGTMTTLWKFDDAVILPHGRKASQVEYDYSVHKTYLDTSELSKEIRERYTPDYYVMDDLVVIYCYTDDGSKPDIDELYELWYTSNNHESYFTPVYSDNVAGKTLSEYAIILEISNNKYLETPAPR